MADFCSSDFAVRSPCIIEAINWSHTSHRAETVKQCENLESVSAVLAKLSWNFHPSLCCCSALVGNQQYLFVDILLRNALFWLLVPEKISSCLQRSGTKYRFLMWAKRSTALHAVMVHSARCIVLLLASFDVALPSEREKPSWISWTIEISVGFDDWLTIMKHLVEIKSLFPCGMIRHWNLVSAPCSETGPNFRALLFVDRWL